MMAFIESKLLVYEGLASIDFSSVPDIAATQDWPTALVKSSLNKKQKKENQKIII